MRKLLEIFKAADIYGLTAEELSNGRSNLEVVEQLIAAGVTVIQYREKDKKARHMYAECLAIREKTRAAGVVFIVNDHVDLALAVDADGVHIGQDDLPPSVVRQLIGPDRLLGLSSHAPEQAQAAVSCGVVDYIGVGPIFPTQTKKDVGAAVGFEYLRYVAENISLPFVAIGGIKEHNAQAVWQQGARMLAIVSDIVGADNIPAKVASIRKTIQKS